MPELPEVETMVSYLRERAVDGEVQNVRISRNPGDRYTGSKSIVGQVLHTIGRRGKYMVFQMSEGLLICHNAMSGYWDIKGDEWCFDYVEGERKASNTDVRVEIDVICDKERKTIRFHDARLFGFLKWYNVRSIEEIPVLHNLGPEALKTVNVDLTTDKSKLDWCILDACAFNMKHEIKHALMDQRTVAGFGNIYAAETLHRAGIDPFKICKKLDGDDWAKIFRVGPRILQEALDRKLDYSGLLVYRQDSCKFCNTKIVKKDLRGRSTYFCPSCQK